MVGLDRDVAVGDAGEGGCDAEVVDEPLPCANDQASRGLASGGDATGVVGAGSPRNPSRDRCAPSAYGRPSRTAWPSAATMLNTCSSTDFASRALESRRTRMSV